MTKDRKEQEHVKSFVTGSYPRVKVNSPINLEPNGYVDIPDKTTPQNKGSSILDTIMKNRSALPQNTYSRMLPLVREILDESKERHGFNYGEVQRVRDNIQNFSAVKTIKETIGGIKQHGVSNTAKAAKLSEKAKDMAIAYAKANKLYQYVNDGEYYQKGYNGEYYQKGYNGGYYDGNGNYYYEPGKGKNTLITWDNTADALRHSMWNSMLTRELGYEESLFYANNHEIEELKRIGMFIEENDGVITTKMNQPTLMDIWNNSTGRALAMDENLNDMDYEQLFNHALSYDMLITDATKAYEFYGITEYIDTSDWTVNVEWDTKNGTITVKKEGLPDKTINVGRWAL